MHRKKRRKIVSLSLPAAAILLMLAGEAFSVMPPEHYAKLVRESKIKAIATVLSVEVIERTKQN